MGIEVRRRVLTAPCEAGAVRLLLFLTHQFNKLIPNLPITRFQSLYPHIWREEVLIMADLRAISTGAANIQANC